jgi:hypothetical protein
LTSERDAVVPSFVTVVLSESFSVFSDSVPIVLEVEPVAEEPEPLADADALASSLIVMVLFVRSSSFTLPITSFELVVVLDPVDDVVEPEPDVEGSLEPVVPDVEVSDDVLPWPDCVLVLLFSSSLVDMLEPPVVCAGAGLAARRSPATPRPITTPNPFRLMCSLPALFRRERSTPAAARVRLEG